MLGELCESPRAGVGADVDFIKNVVLQVDTVPSHVWAGAGRQEYFRRAEYALRLKAGGRIRSFPTIAQFVQIARPWRYARNDRVVISARQRFKLDDARLVEQAHLDLLRMRRPNIELTRPIHGSD